MATTLTAYTPGGRIIAQTVIGTGSERNARYVPRRFVLSIEGGPYVLVADVKRGPKARRLVKIGRSYYTRVKGA